MQEYFFDMGNSTWGPIGFCARVWAETAEEAAEKVRDSLPEFLPVESDDKSISYINVYFNPDVLAASDAKDSAEW